MLSAGTQSSFSSNWKPALVGSKRAHRISEIRKVTTEVTSATLRQLRSTASFGPLTIRQNSAPSSGRNVTTERIGQLVIALPHEHEVGDQSRHADQHGEGVVVQIARLEAHQHARHVLGTGGDVIGTEPVDRRLVALLPEEASDPERRLNDRGVVELVEVPLVVEQRVDAREALGGGLRQPWHPDV